MNCYPADKFMNMKFKQKVPSIRTDKSWNMKNMPGSLLWSVNWYAFDTTAPISDLVGAGSWNDNNVPVVGFELVTGDANLRVSLYC